MAASIDKQQKFIELRAGGLSYDKISARIDISKPTLIKWSKEFSSEIYEVTQLIEKQFYDEQMIKRTVKAEILGRQVEEAYQMLQKTSFDDLSKKEIIKVIISLESQLKKFIDRMGPNSHFFGYKS